MEISCFEWKYISDKLSELQKDGLIDLYTLKKYIKLFVYILKIV